jgi:hypothetical protein
VASPRETAVRRFGAVAAASLAVKVAALLLFVVLVARIAGGP